MTWRNEEFDLGGLSHPALVCSGMKRTAEFCTEVPGMRLIKTKGVRVSPVPGDVRHGPGTAADRASVSA